MPEIKLNIENEKTDKPKYDEYEIKDAVRTLIEAEEIKNNAELMTFVAPELEKRAKAARNAAEILYGKENK